MRRLCCRAQAFATSSATSTCESTYSKFTSGWRSAMSRPLSNTPTRGTATTSASESAGGAASGNASSGAGITLRMKDLSKQEKIIVCIIFAITGSSAAAIVRPTLRLLARSSMIQSVSSINEESSFRNGPNSYRAMYFLVMWPMYSMLLLFYGTLFQRRIFFSHFVAKMWGRFLPKPAINALRRVLQIEQRQ